MMLMMTDPFFVQCPQRGLAGYTNNALVALFHGMQQIHAMHEPTVVLRTAYLNTGILAGQWGSGLSTVL